MVVSAPPWTRDFLVQVHFYVGGCAHDGRTHRREPRSPSAIAETEADRHMESKAIARFARIAPRKARTVVNLVRGRKVAEAIDMLMYTRKSAAPIVRKIIESALANAKKADPSVDVDALYVTTCAVDKGPNRHMRRWRPRAMGRATRIAKGVSHIAITLTDTAPAPKRPVRAPMAKAPTNATAAAPASAPATTPEAGTQG